jgi:hypothetical protein
MTSMAPIGGLHPDVEWIEPDEFPNGGRRQGRAAVAEYLRGARKMWAELVSEASAIRRGDDIVIIHHVSGRLIDGSITTKPRLRTSSPCATAWRCG